MTARTCIIPGCGQPVTPQRAERLCDAHYAPVSDDVVARKIAQALASRWWEEEKR